VRSLIGGLIGSRVDLPIPALRVS